MLGSNQRRLSRRFYSPILLPEAYAADQRVTRFEARFRAAAVRYASVGTGFRGRAVHDRGEPATDGRGPAHGRPRTSPRTRRKRPRTGPVGAVTLTVSPGFSPLTCHFRMPARCRRLPRHRGLRLGVLGAEGVGDALVGGVGLPVDAVGVDLEQDRDAVPGAAGDLGGGHPGVQPQRDRGVPQVVGAAAERRPVLGGGEGLLAGLGPRPRCRRSPGGCRPGRSGRSARPGSCRTS